MVPWLFFSSENLGENILQDDTPGKKKAVQDLSQNSIDDQAVILFRSK